MLARRIAIASVIGAATLGIAAEAGAFCRSTTCTQDCPRDADGCKTTGEPLVWPSRCVGFSLQEDGTANLPMSDVRPVIEGAFYTWTDLPCDTGTASIAFSELATVSCHQAEYNPGAPNANVILFQDTKWEYTDADNNLAKTTVTFDRSTGQILDADMEINFAFNEITIGDDHVVYDLASIVTHEVGHFIGLDHSPDPTATMFASYDEGSTSQRVLGDDDLAAACVAYPPEREAVCDPEPKNGLGDACATSEDGGGGGGCAIASVKQRSSSGEGAAACAVIAIGAIAARRRKRGGVRAERRT